MAHNSLYPAFVKFKYTGGGREHTQTLPVKPYNLPIPGDEPTLESVAETAIPFTDFLDAWADVIVPYLEDTDSVISGEFWHVPDVDADPIFIFASPFSGRIGTSVGTALESAGRQVTFRTHLGGLLRILILEGTFGSYNNRTFPPYTGPDDGLSDYLLSSSNCVIGRDGGRPIVSISSTTKIYDALRKKQLDL